MTAPLLVTTNAGALRDPAPPRPAVRAATHADVEEMLRVRETGARRAYSRLGDEYLQSWLESRCSAEWLHDLVDDDKRVLLVATRGDRILGMAAVRFDDDGSAYFGDLYCEERGGGAGTALHQAREEIARAHGCRLAWCTVYLGNDDAAGFLAHRGWRATGMTPSQVMEGGFLVRHELPL